MAQTNSILVQNNSNSIQNKNDNIQNNSFYALYKQEIFKRFNDKQWEQNLTSLSERALRQEYTRMLGISNHLAYMNIQRKQRIEALLATYSAIKLQNK